MTVGTHGGECASPKRKAGTDCDPAKTDDESSSFHNESVHRRCERTAIGIGLAFSFFERLCDHSDIVVEVYLTIVSVDRQADFVETIARPKIRELEVVT